MARTNLDDTLNSDLGRQIAVLNAMLVELYAASSTSPNPSVTTITASGLASVGSLTSTGLAVAGSLGVDTGTKTAAATAGAATLNKNAGVITSEALTTIAGASYVLTLTNSAIAAGDQVFASVQYGTATTGSPAVVTTAPASGSVVITIQNVHASAALNGTIKIAFAVFKN